MQVISALGAALGPNLRRIAASVVLVVLVRFPMLRRGPNSSTRDVWRRYKHGARRVVLARAGDRCEGAGFLVRAGARRLRSRSSLERRRRDHFPSAADERVFAVLLSDEDAAARTSAVAGR